MIAVPKVLDLSHENRVSLTNCMCNLGSVRRCQNFLVCTEYSEYAAITECSYVSEIFNLVDQGMFQEIGIFLTCCDYSMFVGFGFVS